MSFVYQEEPANSIFFPNGGVTFISWILFYQQTNGECQNNTMITKKSLVIVNTRFNYFII
jgi:hypothetical protein